MADTQEMLIKLSSYNRTPKDLSHWKTAVKAAEDPDYPDRSLLMNLYHDIISDGHLTAITEKRILSILNTQIVFNEKEKENDLINDLMETEAFEQLLRYIIESKLYGHSLCWVDFTLPGVNDPKTKLIDRRHVVPELHIYKYKESDNNKAGIDYTEQKYIPYTITAGFNNDLGLLMKCAPYVLLKRGAVSDWATFAELFGIPLRVGKYPIHDTKARDELIVAIDESGSAASIVLPDGTSIDFIENKTSTSGKTVHETLADFCNKEMSKIILGNTMTTDAEGGNYKGEVHADAEKAINKSDRRFVLRILNSKLKRNILESHGYNPGNGKFKVPDQDSTTLTDRIKIDKDLSEIIEIPPEYFHEKYNIPIPKGGAKLKSNSQDQQQPGKKQKEELSLQQPPIKKRGFNFFG